MKKPLYIALKRLQRASNEEIRQLFQEVFQVTYPEHTQIRNNILTALFYCSYLTASDLSYYLGMPEKSFKSLHKQLNDMERAGLIKKTQLKTKDAFSRVLYYLTENGFATSAAFIGIPYYFNYKRRGKQITTMHDYSVGLNALQLILYGTPFLWDKEVSYAAALGGMKKTGSLCVDAICDFKDTPYRMYIEEDLGSESTGVLLGKLEKYHQYGLLKDGVNELVVYSFRQPYLTCDSPYIPAYSAKKVEEVRKWLLQSEKTLLGAVACLQGNLLDEGTEKILKTMESLVQVLELQESNKDITAESLKFYLSDLRELKLDCRVRDHNKMQEKFTRGRFRSMAVTLARNYRKAPYSNQPYVSDLMKGFPIYCCSTTLLMNEIPYYFYKQASMQYSFAFYLNELFPGIKEESYEEVLEPYLTKPSGNMCVLGLRNAFSFAYGKVCVEYLGRDLGAVLRILRYIDSYMNTDSRVYLVCMLEQLSDFNFFHKSIFPEKFITKIGKENIPYLIFLDKASLSGIPEFYALDKNEELIKI